MKYRLLAADEWDKLSTLVPIDVTPAPGSAAAAVAEDDEGELQGVLFLQITLHMEPLVLANPKVNFERLYETLYESLEERKGLHFYAFADSDVVGKMAEHLGLERLPWSVYQGEVN